jgi:hypothetical protein
MYTEFKLENKIVAGFERIGCEIVEWSEVAQDTSRAFGLHTRWGIS